MATAHIAEIKLAKTFDARVDALAVGGDSSVPEAWSQAEANFREAALTLEEGEAKWVSNLALKAEEHYRDAELMAIKTQFLESTRNLLRQTEKEQVNKYVPQTLAQAQALLLEAETALEEDRYDHNKPRSLAREAKYTAQHALYISSQLRAVKKKDHTLEELYLQLESPLTAIAGAANIVADLSEGTEATTRQVIDYIETANRIARDHEESQARVAALEKQSNSLSSESRRLKSQLAEEAEIAATFNEVNKLFTRQEADVFRKGDNVIIRLVGLNFPVGQAVIETKNMSYWRKCKKP